MTSIGTPAPNPRNRLVESEDIRRELDRLTVVFNEVSEDNSQLMMDIERYKESVRVVSAQNEELIMELERISEQDEQVRHILNRRSRIEGLIAKAET